MIQYEKTRVQFQKYEPASSSSFPFVSAGEAMLIPSYFMVIFELTVWMEVMGWIQTIFGLSFAQFLSLPQSLSTLKDSKPLNIRASGSDPCRAFPKYSHQIGQKIYCPLNIGLTDHLFGHGMNTVGF